ncbi:MAG: hypothetical protein M0015_08765 [Betaproteobacteria bacterium]|nr:hypothetical protein [Betaproteobacteria bacterium]
MLNGAKDGFIAPSGVAYASSGHQSEITSHEYVDHGGHLLANRICRRQQGLARQQTWAHDREASPAAGQIGSAHPGYPTLIFLSRTAQAGHAASLALVGRPRVMHEPKRLPKQATEEPPRQIAILVLGMYRSGTSATAGALHYLGVEFGGPLLEPRPDDNPRGFFEHLEICSLHEKILALLGSNWDDPRALPAGWHEDRRVLSVQPRIEAVLKRDFASARTWAVKDPRLCRLMALWIPLLKALNTQMRCVLVIRHPSEVAASLATRHGLSPVHSGLLWLRHVLEAEQATRGHRRAWLLYPDLVRYGRESIDALGRILGVEWPNDSTRAHAAVGEFLTGELKHHESNSFVEFTSPFASWLERLYDAAAEISRTGLQRMMEVANEIRNELAAGFDQPGRIKYIPNNR